MAAHAADSVFDAAFLPRFVGVAEEGGEAEASGELVMLSELGAVIEGDGLAPGGRERFEQVDEACEHGRGGFVGLAGEAQMAGGAFVKDQDGLAVFSEEHEIGFPGAGPGAVVGFRGAIVNRHAVREEVHRAASASAESSPAGLAARQEAVPVILLGGAVVDKAVNRLVRDHRLAVHAAQPAGDLLGGPAFQQAFPHRGAQLGRGGELVGSAPLAAPVGERLRPQRIVTSFPGLGHQAVAPQFPANGRRRATEANSDRPLRFTVCMQTVNLNPLLHRQLPISFSHRNTSYTSKVLHLQRELSESSGGPPLSRG